MYRKNSVFRVQDANVKDLQEELRFDHRLKEQYNTIDDDKAKKAQNFQKKWLSKPKNIALLFYYFVIPFIQTPDWCTKRYAEKCKNNGNTKYRLEVTYDCSSVANGIRYSGFPNFSPLITAILDITCLLILTIFRIYKKKWRHLSKNNLYRTYALIVITILCIIDEAYAIVNDSYPFIDDFMRPVVVLIFLTSIRTNMKQVLYSARDAIPIILLILLYIAFFSFLGFYMFRGTL